jgi:TIR domain/SIR2-like domain
MDEIQNIVGKISKGECVLIVGPDIVDFGEKSFFEKFCEAIYKDNYFSQFLAPCPPNLFAREELLQLTDDGYLSDVRGFMQNYYSEQTIFNEPLELIAQIKFPLIISLFSDTRLNRMFEQLHLPFEYRFQPLSENPMEVELPTVDKPIIYNLLGDIAEEGIITFDNLFTYLQGILGGTNLPTNIKHLLGKPNTSFLFLGVHFEKWYIQLLLRIIMTKGKRNFTSLKSANSDEMCTFIATRLRLSLSETEPLDYLKLVYEECKRQNILKVASKPERKKVFISYSHEDKEIVLKLEQRMLDSDIDVVRDEVVMTGGQEIKKFISIINEVDSVLTIISASSLKSTWVCEEILTALDNDYVNFHPCSLDKSYESNAFVDGAVKIADDKLDEIFDQLKLKKRESNNHLETKKNQLNDYIKNLPKIIDHLRLKKCTPLLPDFENACQKIIAEILSGK